MALLRRGWWRALPGGLTAVVLAVVYWRLARAPSGSFVDPVLRHAVRPSWGFVPMGIAVLVGLIGATRTRRTVRERSPRPEHAAPSV